MSQASPIATRGCSICGATDHFKSRHHAAIHGLRQCSRCGEMKKPEAFYDRNDGKRGKRTVCIPCTIARDVARARARRVGVAR